MTLPTYRDLPGNTVTTIDVTADTRPGQTVRVSVSSTGDAWVTGDSSTPTVNGTGCTVIRAGDHHATVTVTGTTTRAVKIRTTVPTTAKCRIDRSPQ